MDRPLSLEPFADQSRYQHLATVSGGIVVCLVAYFVAVFLVYSDLTILANETAITPQRVGGLVGGLAVWGYYALAFIRGYGSPVLNSTLYPLLTTLVAPFPARWILFGPDLTGLRSRFVGLWVVEPLITAVIVIMPSVGLYVTILTIWAWLLDDESREQWEQTKLTPAFYEAFVESD